MSVNIKQNGDLVRVANNISIVQANWNDKDDPSKSTCIRNQPDTLNTLEEISANTDENALAGANAVKELNDSLSGMNNKFNNYVLNSNVIDTLNSDSGNKPLSARQGKMLDNKINTLNTKVDDGLSSLSETLEQYNITGLAFTTTYLKGDNTLQIYFRKQGNKVTLFLNAVTENQFAKGEAYKIITLQNSSDYPNIRSISLAWCGTGATQLDICKLYINANSSDVCVVPNVVLPEGTYIQGQLEFIVN